LGSFTLASCRLGLGLGIGWVHLGALQVGARVRDRVGSPWRLAGWESPRGPAQTTCRPAMAWKKGWEEKKVTMVGVATTTVVALVRMVDVRGWRWGGREVQARETAAAAVVAAAPDRGRCRGWRRGTRCSGRPRPARPACPRPCPSSRSRRKPQRQAARQATRRAPPPPPPRERGDARAEAPCAVARVSRGGWRSSAASSATGVGAGAA
jgi:hypothetical protein